MDVSGGSGPPLKGLEVERRAVVLVVIVVIREVLEELNTVEEHSPKGARQGSWHPALLHPERVIKTGS